MLTGRRRFNVTKICNSRTTLLVVMELALLLVMVAVEMMVFSLDLSSKLLVLDTMLTDTKLCACLSCLYFFVSLI